MYALEISFVNAKVFLYPSDPRKTARYAEKYPNNFSPFADTLWYLHVANALQCLCGLRPIPTVRDVVIPLPYRFDERVLECAKEALVEINSPVYHTSNNGNSVNVSEVFAGIKANSGIGGSGPYDKGCFTKRKMKLNGEYVFLDNAPLTWDRIQYLMGEFTWDSFKVVLNRIIGVDFKSHTVYSSFEYLNTIYRMNINGFTPIHDFFNKFYHDEGADFRKKNKVTRLNKPIYMVICEGVVENQFFHQGGYGVGKYKDLMDSVFVKYVNHSPEKVTTISGKIYLKISQDIYDMIEEYGFTSARILEGGLVSINKCKDIRGYSWTMNTMCAVPVATDKSVLITAHQRYTAKKEAKA